MKLNNSNPQLPEESSKSDAEKKENNGKIGKFQPKNRLENDYNNIPKCTSITGISPDDIKY